MFQKCDTAHMPWRVPRVGPLIGVLHQLAEIWRQQLLVIALDGEVDAVGNECRRVTEQVDVFVHLLHHFQRQLADKRAIGDQKNRQLLVAAADGTNDAQRGALVKLVVFRKVPVQQDGALRWIGIHQRQPIFGRSCSYYAIAFPLDRLDQSLHGAIGHRIGSAYLTCDEQNPPALFHLLTSLLLSSYNSYFMRCYTTDSLSVFEWRINFVKSLPCSRQYANYADACQHRYRLQKWYCGVF